MLMYIFLVILKTYEFEEKCSSKETARNKNTTNSPASISEATTLSPPTNGLSPAEATMTHKDTQNALSTNKQLENRQSVSLA